MTWLRKKLGWFVCLAGGLTLTAAGLAALLLFFSFSGGDFCHPCLLTMLLATPLGLCLAKLGLVVSGD